MNALRNGTDCGKSSRASMKFLIGDGDSALSLAIAGSLSLNFGSISPVFPVVVPVVSQSSIHSHGRSRDRHGSVSPSQQRRCIICILTIIVCFRNDRWAPYTAKVPLCPLG